MIPDFLFGKISVWASLFSSVFHPTPTSLPHGYAPSHTLIQIFYEEELDVPLVIFDDVLEHVLRIDGVLRQPMGHLLLVGESGVGKTVLTRFASWMNGLSVFQVCAGE